MDFVDDIDFIPRPRRSLDRIPAQLPNIIHTRIRCTVDLNDVDILPAVHRDTTIALTAGLRRRLIELKAIKSLGKNPRHSRLAHPPRTRKKIGMCNPTALDSILQRLGNSILPDNIIKSLRPKPPRQNSVSHNESSLSESRGKKPGIENQYKIKKVAGFTTAQRRDRLWLLSSLPDQVHVRRLHGTRPL